MRGACPECNVDASKVRTLPNKLLRAAVEAAAAAPVAPTSRAAAAAPASSGAARKTLPGQTAAHVPPLDTSPLSQFVKAQEEHRKRARLA